MYPKIDRPCPYGDNLPSVMEGDFCTACKCAVFDLDAMKPRERRSFLKRTEGVETCVTYKIKPALAAAALLATMGVAAPAVAQDVDEEEPQIVVTGGRGGLNRLPEQARERQPDSNVRGPAAPTPPPPAKSEDDEFVIVTAGRVAMPKPKQGS